MGVLMAEMGDGTQGLAKKSTPVSNSLLPQGEKGECGRPDALFSLTPRPLPRAGEQGIGHPDAPPILEE